MVQIVTKGLQPLLPIIQAILPTTPKHFDWAASEKLVLGVIAYTNVEVYRGECQSIKIFIQMKVFGLICCTFQ